MKTLKSLKYPFITQFRFLVDLFDIVNSRFERDWDQARLQGEGLDWFSRSGVIAYTLEPVGNFTSCTISHILTNFVVNTCQNMYKIKVNLCPVAFDTFINYYFDSKTIYCLISLYNFTNNKETSRLANSPGLKLLLGNVGNASVILHFRICERN